jgi:Fe-S oxidoreductase
MAGSFGFTNDRYELSMKIGELVLLPAVRGAGAGATAVAPGTSCRHQIHDGAGVRALHPVEVVAGLLES